ncbi:MAG: tetratricopeptide repeat protein, partial [Gemmatimonadetes bacterium]|nr:tetratricopeptide repeat protein [Gemmatimonadota bacterium]
MKSTISTPALRQLLSACLMLASAAACARTVPTVGPDDIARLEDAVAAAPADLPAMTQLGVAYYRGDRPKDAQAILERVVGQTGASGVAFLYLGLAHEAQDNWTLARESYTRYLELGRSDALKEEIRARLVLVLRNEMRQQARLALEREAELTAQPATPRTIAVFPLRLVSEKPELEPLQVALADMIITDLQLSGALRLLERVRVQSLLDEMALTEAGYAEPATGARAGRLLGAEHVVQGVLATTGENAVRMDVSVLAAAEQRAAGELGNESPLEALFDLEKELVFGVLNVLGIELTAAEREAISENRAANLLAFLTYGNGLQAMDRGDYAEAVRLFQQAVQLDPSLGAARERQGEAAQLQRAGEVTPQQIAQTGLTELPA